MTPPAILINKRWALVRELARAQKALDDLEKEQQKNGQKAIRSAIRRLQWQIDQLQITIDAQTQSENEAFWGEGGKAAFMERIRDRLWEGLCNGIRDGLWENFDIRTLEPIAPVKVFRISDFHDKATLANVMAKAGIFPSVSIARKNGWDKPLQPGEWTVTKKKIRIRVVEG